MKLKNWHWILIFRQSSLYCILYYLVALPVIDYWGLGNSDDVYWNSTTAAYHMLKPGNPIGFKDYSLNRDSKYEFQH